MMTNELTASELGRVHARVPIDVSVTMESDHNFYAGITDNISEGGVFVATLDPPPHGSEVELALTLPDSGESFRVRGAVCWIRDARAASEGMPPGCGIRFTAMPPRALQAIASFVARRDTILFELDEAA